MSEQKPDYRVLTRDELDAIAGEPLPERAAMSLVNANVALPIKHRARGERPERQRDRDRRRAAGHADRPEHLVR